MNGKTNSQPAISSMQDFDIITELGKGSFGIVFKVKRKTDDNIYALKKVYLSKLKLKEKNNALNEIRILASISHPNIIKYKDAFYDDQTQCLCLVMEYADHGDLEKKILIKERNKQYYSENEVLSLFIQVTKALKALHEANIIHRDMKSANIFIFKDNVVKIGDFNVSKLIKSDLKHTQTGTPFYASPEVWDNIAYDYKSDIWSLGCLLYEICALKAPFRGNTMKMVYDKVKKGVYDPIPRFYSKGLGGLIYVCLQTNPLQRPTCTQLLSIISTKASTFNSIPIELLLSSNSNGSDNNYNCKEARNALIDINEIPFKETEEEKHYQRGSNQLLGTIKLPRRMIEINQMLPKNHYASSETRRINSASKLYFKLPKVIKSTHDRLRTNHSELIGNNSDINLLIKKESKEEKYNNIMNYHEPKLDDSDEIREEIHVSPHNSCVYTDNNNNQDKKIDNNQKDKDIDQGVNKEKEKPDSNHCTIESIIPLRKLQINKKEIMNSLARDADIHKLKIPMMLNQKIIRRNIKSQNVSDIHNITDLSINNRIIEQIKPQIDLTLKYQSKNKENQNNGRERERERGDDRDICIPEKSNVNKYELKPIISNGNVRASSALIQREDNINHQPNKICRNMNTIDSVSKYQKGNNNSSFINNSDIANKINSTNNRNVYPEMSDQQDKKGYHFHFLPTIDRNEIQITPSIIKANDQLNQGHKNLNTYNKKEIINDKKGTNITNNNQDNISIAQPFLNCKQKIQNIPVKLCKLPFDNKKINFESHETIAHEVNKIIKGYKMIKNKNISFI